MIMVAANLVQTPLTLVAFNLKADDNKSDKNGNIDACIIHTIPISLQKALLGSPRTW